MNTSCYKLRRKGFDAMIGAHWKLSHPNFPFLTRALRSLGQFARPENPRLITIEIFFR